MTLLRYLAAGKSFRTAPFVLSVNWPITCY
jgi:hypothetical protein